MEIAGVNCRHSLYLGMRGSSCLPDANKKAVRIPSLHIHALISQVLHQALQRKCSNRCGMPLLHQMPSYVSIEGRMTHEDCGISSKRIHRHTHDRRLSGPQLVCPQVSNPRRYTLHLL